jgi:hypothetical protein
MLRQTLFVVVAFNLFSLPVYADTRLVYQQGSDTGSQFELIVKDGKLGVLQNGGTQLSLLFDQSTATFAFVDHTYRQYTEISEQAMFEANKRMQEEMDRMQAKLDEQMKTMTPEQQAMVKQGKMGMQMMPAMKGFGMPAAQPKNHVPSLTTMQIDNRQCRRVDTYQAGQVVQTQCVAERESLGLSQSDYDTITAFLRATANLARQGVFTMGFTAPPMPELSENINGLPVQATHMIAGKQVTISLNEVSLETVDSTTFDLPANYIKAEIPLPGG